MKVSVILFLLIFSSGPTASGVQLGAHKSKSEMARMTPDQRAEEYCTEDARHGAQHGDYTGILYHYVMQDGLRAVPALTRIIAEYDPTTPAGRTREKARRFDAALSLLSDVDQTVVRLRASRDGRAAIATTKGVIERMRAAGFRPDPDLNYEKRVWYESSVEAVERMEGLNRLDNAIGNTLRIKFKIRLTDQELVDFVNYLISKDAYYPTGIGMDLYKDFDDLTPAGYPRQYHVVPYIEPFYKAYLEYKAKAK